MAPAKRSAEYMEELRSSLLEAARRLVGRGGAGALTMRALAAEAGCAVGLPYKVFASREALVAELVRAEFARLEREFEMWIAAAGEGTVGGNLARYARILLDSPVVKLAHGSHAELAETIDEQAAETGIVPLLETTVTRYLAAEKAAGRVAAAVDEHAFGFLIAGAIHNLLASGELYPRPSPERLEELLAAAAASLAPVSGGGDV